VPFDRPTLTELQAQAETDVASHLGLGSLLRRGMLRVIARAAAGLAHLLHGHVDWAARQLFPDTADGDELGRWADIFGVPRLPAERADGTVRFTGTDGTAIAAGATLRRSDAAEFRTTDSGSISGGVLDLPAEASLPGLDGDTSSGAGALTLSPAVAGASSSAEVLAPGLEGGSDREDDESLRARLLVAMRAGRRGGSAGDYEAWVLSFAYVSQAFVERIADGPGTVWITFLVSSGSTAPIPDAAQVAEVQAYVDERRPITADVLVYAPGVLEVDVTLSIAPDTLAVRAAIEASLQDLLAREGSPGATVYLSHFQEAISQAAGEVDHALAAPAADVAVPIGSVAALGALVFT